MPLDQSAAILALQFGALDEDQLRVARDGYGQGRAEAKEHTASLTRPMPASASIPF